MAAQDEFANQATALALRSLEEDLIAASRVYEDSIRGDDPVTAADALKSYATTKQSYDALAKAGQQQRSPDNSARAQMNFLQPQAAGGDTLDPQRMQDYARGHDKALAAGLRVDSPEYFSAVANFCDHLGDGRQPPLSESEAARLCGLTDAEYAQQAARLRQMKRNGSYRNDQVHGLAPRRQPDVDTEAVPETPPVENAEPEASPPTPAPELGSPRDDATLALQRQIDELKKSETLQQQAQAMQVAKERRQLG